MALRVLSIALCLTKTSPIVAGFGLAILCTGSLLAQEAKQSTHASRTAWTTSQLKGSPESPLPLAIEPVFPGVKFSDPMHVRWQADVGRYFVCELGGKVWSFPHDAEVKTADLAIDLKASLKSFDAERSNGCDSLYSLAFDPEFSKNRFVYLCIILSNKTGKPLPDGSRISRFRVTEEQPPRIDVDSELPIITWLGGGHNGCDIAFDASGCMLFSTGDATDPSPPDQLKTGQDISDLLSSILRIDVRERLRKSLTKFPKTIHFAKSTKREARYGLLGFAIHGVSRSTHRPDNCG